MVVCVTFVKHLIVVVCQELNGRCVTSAWVTGNRSEWDGEDVDFAYRRQGVAEGSTDAFLVSRFLTFLLIFIIIG